MSLSDWSETRRALLDEWMRPLFEGHWPPEFAEPCRYPLFGGGKRMRPLLVMAAYEAVGGATLEDCFPAAASLELIHTYSLVHDDLPCMDDDDERRGRPTVHKAFDEATAVLAGDALLTEAFRVVIDSPVAAQVGIELVRELSEAAGHRGMVGGQAADVGRGASITDEADLIRVHRMKTGALFRAGLRMGGMVAGANTEQLGLLTEFGAALGLAFQVADDLLDEDEADDDDGPPSFVRLLGVDETRVRAHALADEAVVLARQLKSDVLEELARYTVERSV